MAYKLRHGPIRMYGGGGDGDPEKGKGEGKTPPQPKPQVKEASLGLPPAGIQPFPSQLPTSSSPFLQPITPKSPPPPPSKRKRKIKKSFKYTNVGKAVNTIGDGAVNLVNNTASLIGGIFKGKAKPGYGGKCSTCSPYKR